MKYLFIPLMLSFLAFSVLFSCRSDSEDVLIAIPEIEIEEVGIDNSRIAYPGQDLHIQAAINAPGRIASVKLQITLSTTNYGWDYNQSYGVYAGLLKADFHEHINIPTSATAGVYTMLIVVTDEQGQKAQHKIDFEIKKDPSLPVINNIVLKVVGPELLNLSGIINAPDKIGRVEVQVQSSVWTKNYVYNDPDMVGQTSFQFDKDIEITGAPSGHYHINVKIYDKYNKSMFYQFHLDR